ncbi:nucleotidyltransferase family protein [Aetokthonos hydrillicola Thurmond2011]|jgi:molybdenum cofactor cytidylyltransferase|uniref:Nucleotidyltransferase family protein n=1 Tax=Aetokthonos hydrillicola Thurmond2011 TaxID=2712845 RepID=A0AAP5I8Z0_9CYAN|nr:nucleotidyltransferase family protein [Aetokthonos hydrillicola]MBO3458633.1 nucleotidyltransferase family protein [Aetokthonos hydrillicola CCALA 1050]MBW4587986.1 nucleotidyltransferase family protein [Aetokthonos hydrillicola CCALA 1050]MDR9897061.1 nucleotidyltransferase family protein [Aetokthonos hydrillicola Thurmond2011]
MKEVPKLIERSSSVGLILVAAGSSTRMGYPKQLLRYGDCSLITHMIQVALASQCRHVLVVLGAYADQIEPEINHFPIQIVHNSNWAEGMGASIKIGVEAVCALSEVPEAVIVMLCDQPLVSDQLLDRLITKYKVSGKQMIVSTYGDTLGVPALFSRAFYPELMSLKLNTGAKQLILQHRSEMEAIAFPEGAIDLDTPTDYEQFLSTRFLN